MNRERTIVGHRGGLTARIIAERPHEIVARADEMRWTKDTRTGAAVLIMRHRNAYVRSGLRNALLREFGLGGTAVGYIGVDNDNTAATYNTAYLHGSAAGTASTTIILPFSPAASIVTDGAGVVQTVTAGATFTNASFTSGVFTINKLGLLTTATDAGTGLVDVFGGASGAAPYDRTFTLGLASAGAFSATLQIAVSAIADPTQ